MHLNERRYEPQKVWPLLTPRVELQTAPLRTGAGAPTGVTLRFEFETDLDAGASVLLAVLVHSEPEERSDEATAALDAENCTGQVVR